MAAAPSMRIACGMTHEALLVLWTVRLALLKRIAPEPKAGMAPPSPQRSRPPPRICAPPLNVASGAVPPSRPYDSGKIPVLINAPVPEIGPRIVSEAAVDVPLKVVLLSRISGAAIVKLLLP